MTQPVLRETHEPSLHPTLLLLGYFFIFYVFNPHVNGEWFLKLAFHILMGLVVAAYAYWTRDHQVDLIRQIQRSH
jgi:hypothetical protein